MKFYQILLIPVSFLYGIILLIRNLFFDFGLLTEKKFKTPIISIGNLSTGGTGKTPHIEYLVRLLKENFNPSVLSRGYGRKSSGFILADETKNASDIGDEPLQIKNKYNNVVVAVCNSRVSGINKLLAAHPEIDTILLDDAYQHRYVKPGISILLTDYSKLYANDFVLPSGNLREFSSGASRADIIIVSKTPQIFSPLDRRFLTNKLNPKPYQKIFFSYTAYGDLVSLKTRKVSPFDKEYYFDKNFAILLITGIANSANMVYYLENKSKEVRHIAFSDHYKYNQKDLEQIKNLFDNIAAQNKIIITTEKDAMRLAMPELKEITEKLPIFYIPIEIKFHGQDEQTFNQHIVSYVKQN
ncbi:MAG: tetraacyldisaccharide 4'-kinase [Bacteroidetes bacterium]|nr:tetraacyldisaccharide 4'-kinase [Bacteroidota bacterium]HET6244870.1 tetraacyldisaccharide 4'-kinase [Bacteroidia bacterium]